ncbi:MAG TPA: hypothetical protein VKX17_13960 [Planctomycetota bacterium]|nr:hypothetical protein [Planctomycetota bacterium]
MPAPSPKPPSAPDGLPSPPGYFDAPLKEPFDEALADYGVRPNHYVNGRAVYTQKERDDPKYIGTIPPESPENEALFKAAWEAADAREMILRGAKQRSDWAPMQIRLVRMRVGKTTYYRPCMVMKLTDDGNALVFLLSTRDVSKPGKAFEIDASHPDFAATGLRETSYTLFPLQLVAQE